MPQRTFSKFVLLCFACRDVWASEAVSDGVYVRETRFRDFKCWLLNAFDRAEPPEPVVELLKLLVSPNDPNGYRKDELKQYLDVRQNDRDYRAVASGDVGNHDGDFRVRNLMEALIAEKQQSRVGGSAMAVWICPFFTSRTQEFIRQRKKEIAHRTECCSRFEQMLFLMGVSKLSSLFSNRRARKKQRVGGEESGVGTSLESITKFNGSISQKLGHGVQKICRGWNAIAVHFGFEGLDEMILPYTRIVGPPFEFEVVPSRGEGFVPASQRKILTINVGLTTLKSETFPDAFDRSVEIDKNVRALVEQFFSDFYSIIVADDLYGETVWTYLKEYETSGGGLPDRFKTLNSAMVDVLEGKIRPVSTAEAVKMQSTLDQLPVVESGMGERTTKVGHVAMEGTETGSEGSDGEGSGRGTESTTEEHFSIMQEELQKSFRMLCCSFEDLVEAHEHLYQSESLLGKAQLVLTDPPYNIRRERGRKNSTYDSLSVKEMDAVVEVFDELLRPGGHGILFCTWQQFPLWVQKFNTYRGKNFVADKTALVMAWHPSSNKSFPRRWSTSLQNCVEQAVHVKKKGLTTEQEGELVNYTNFNFVQSDYPGHKNVINNIRGLEPGEQVRVRDEVDGKVVSLRNEQKPVALLKEIISRFSQPGDLVVDLFSGTFSTAVACFSLSQHRTFLGCEPDKTCFDHSLRHVCLKFAERVCTEGSTVKVAGEVLASAEVVKAFRKKRKKDTQWEPPAGMPQYQAVQEHLVSYLANFAGDRVMYMRFKHRGVHDWPDVMRGKLQEAGVLTLRSIDALASGVVVQKSLIKCEHAGLGVFAVRSFGPNEVIGPFYGTLVYHNLLSRAETKKTYGTGILGVTLERFKRFAIQLAVGGKHFRKVGELMDGQKAVSIVPAKFCAMGYANDYRYHPDDEEFKRSDKSRKVNAVFTGETINHPDELISPFAQVVRATAFINPGDEIYVDYGNTFQVFVNNCK